MRLLLALTLTLACSDYAVDATPSDPLPPVASTLSVAPDSLDFGLFQPDGTGTGTVTLLAEGSVVTIAAAQVEGDGFDLGWDHAGVVLQPGETIPLEIAFVAGSPGPHEGTLRITSDADDGGDLLVPLSADVAGAEIALTPEDQDIALYGAGAVDIASVGVLPLTVSAIDSTDNLAVTGLDAAPVLAPGEHVPVTVNCLVAGEGEVRVYSDAVSTLVATARVMCTCEVVFAYLPGWNETYLGDWPAEVWYDTSPYGPCAVRSADVDYGFTYRDLANTGASVVLVSNVSGAPAEYSEEEVQAIWDYLNDAGAGLVVTYHLSFLSPQGDGLILYENAEIASWVGVDPDYLDPNHYDVGVDVSDRNDAHPLLHDVPEQRVVHGVPGHLGTPDDVQRHPVDGRLRTGRPGVAGARLLFAALSGTCPAE